jgi:hypothetical protein
MPIIETVVYEDDELRMVEERDDAVGFVGMRHEWKPGSVGDNIQLNAEALRAAAQKFATIRTKMQEARTGFNDNSLSPSQQRRAWADIADAINDIAGYLRAAEKARTNAYDTPPEV